MRPDLARSRRAPGARGRRSRVVLARGAERARPSLAASARRHPRHQPWLGVDDVVVGRSVQSRGGGARCCRAPACGGPGAHLGGRRRRGRHAHGGGASPWRCTSLRERSRRRASAKGRASGSSCRCSPETAIAVLALGLLRAVFTPIFSGYAAPAVAVRLQAFEATHLITADAFLRRGKSIELKSTADAAVADGAGDPAVIVVRRRRGAASPTVAMDAARDRWLDDLRAAARRAGRRSPRPTDPETPYMVIYTSGTTGARRARSTSTAASRSRRRRISRTCSTCGRAIACSGSPTSAG